MIGTWACPTRSWTALILSACAPSPAAFLALISSFNCFSRCNKHNNVDDGAKKREQLGEAIVGWSIFGKQLEGGGDLFLLLFPGFDAMEFPAELSPRLLDGDGAAKFINTVKSDVVVVVPALPVASSYPDKHIPK